MGIKTLTETSTNPYGIAEAKLGKIYDTLETIVALKSEIQGVASVKEYVEALNSVTEEMALIGPNIGAFAEASGSVISFEGQEFSASTNQTDALMDQIVSSPQSVLVWVNKERQRPTHDYTTSGATLTFTTPLEFGDSVELLFFGGASLNDVAELVTLAESYKNAASEQVVLASEQVALANEQVVLATSQVALAAQHVSETEDIAAQYILDAEAIKDQHILEAESVKDQHILEAEEIKASTNSYKTAAETAVNNAQAVARTQATWADLATLTPSQIGEGAEVLDTDVGSHTDPHTLVENTPNAGKYSAYGTGIGEWSRIGDTGLSKKANNSDLLPLIVSMGVPTDVEVTGWVIGDYLNYATGVAATSGSYQYAIVDVVEGDVMLISCVTAGAVTALGIWYDENDTYLGYFEKGPSGSSVTYEDFVVEVPTGAAKLGVMTQASNLGAFLLQQVEINDELAQQVATLRQQMTDTQAEIDANADEAALNASALSKYQILDPDADWVEGAYLNVSNGLPDTGVTSYGYNYWAVTEGVYIKLSGRIEGAGTALAYWYDAGDVYLGYTEIGVSGSTIYDDFFVRVPDGATKLGMSQKTSQNATHPSTVKVPTRVSDLAPQVQSIKNSLSEYAVQTPTTSWVEGEYLNISDGQPDALASYGYGFWAVREGEIVKLSGRVSGGSTALAYWFDKDDNYLGYDLPGTVTTTYTDQELTVPIGAVKLGMSQQTSQNANNPSTVKALDFSDAIASRISALEVPAGPWAGRDVVWFGNSIPTGDDVGGKYPELVADALGFTLHQETTGGMAYRAGIQENVTESDSMGWEGMSWTNLAWSLGASETEKQGLIDDWATWQPLLSNNPPATLSSSQEAEMLNTSYTNRLIARHLGANRKDLYIFDNPFNDRNNADDLTTAGADGGEDRTTYLGTMNFLIRLILEDNPHAKIVIIGHYENTQSSRGVTIAAAQQMVADRWSIPIMPLWSKLGWSQENMTFDGSWVASGSNYNWVAGSGDQNMTMLERMLPDNVHPAKDASGAAVNAIAGQITKWILSELN